VAGSDHHSGRVRADRAPVFHHGDPEASQMTRTYERTAMYRATRASNRETPFLADPIRNRCIVTLTRRTYRPPRKTHAHATSCGMSTCRQVKP